MIVYPDTFFKNHYNKPFVLLIVCCFFYHSQTLARDVMLDLSIAEAMNHEMAKERLLTDVPVFFHTQQHEKPVKKFDLMNLAAKTNKITNTVEEGCIKSFVDVIYSLQVKTRKRGGNAVSSIVSNYGDDSIFASTTHYQCGTSTVATRVELEGIPILLED